MTVDAEKDRSSVQVERSIRRLRNENLTDTVTGSANRQKLRADLDVARQEE
jgi:GGDEF domain-containing protein